MVSKLNVQTGLFFEPEVLGTPIGELREWRADALDPPSRANGPLRLLLQPTQKPAEVFVFGKDLGPNALGAHARSFVCPFVILPLEKRLRYSRRCGAGSFFFRWLEGRGVNDLSEVEPGLAGEAHFAGSFSPSCAILARAREGIEEVKMKRTLVLFSICAALAGCSEDAPPSEPIEVTVDTFNVALAGAFIPYESERRQPIVEAIAATESDIICLQEVWEQADKELIRDGVIAAYPHSAFFENDLDTPLDDPTDQDGEVPPAPTGVPCPDEQASDGMNVLDQMNQAVDCLVENCSTTPDATPPEDELGRTISAECASANCVGQVAGLLFGDAVQQRCYACVITQLPTSTFGTMRESCATVVNQDLAFGGQNGVMILSRHPLKNVVNWVIPGTWNRRTILSATVELPNGEELDTYCNHLTPIFDAQPINTFPYTGQYGDGMTGAAGWQAEQELQAQKLIDPRERSERRPLRSHPRRFQHRARVPRARHRRGGGGDPRLARDGLHPCLCERLHPVMYVLQHQPRHKSHR